MSDWAFHKINIQHYGECLLIFKHGEIKQPLALLFPEDIFKMKQELKRKIEEKSRWVKNEG